MDREDGQDVNPFSGRRAKLEAIAMDLKAETTPEKLARNKFKNKFFKEKAKEVRALFFDEVDKQLAELSPRKLLSPGSISFSSDVFVGFEKEGSLPVNYEVRDLIAVSMGGAGVVVFDRESGELVKQLSIGGVHKIRFSPVPLLRGPDLPAEMVTFCDSICRWVTKDWEQSDNDFFETFTPWFASRKELSEDYVPVLIKSAHFIRPVPQHCLTVGNMLRCLIRTLQGLRYSKWTIFPQYTMNLAWIGPLRRAISIQPRSIIILNSHMMRTTWLPQMNLDLCMCMM